MPYVRKGKTVYKERPDGSLGKKVGTSASVAMAKRHLRALYAAESGKPKKKRA